jgi:hypothetical protein
MRAVHPQPPNDAKVAGPAAAKKCRAAPWELALQPGPAALAVLRTCLRGAARAGAVLKGCVNWLPSQVWPQLLPLQHCRRLPCYPRGQLAEEPKGLWIGVAEPETTLPFSPWP